MIDLTDVTKEYAGGVRALAGVTLTIGAGELVAVVGPSGSGKSTLLACLAGLDEPDGGRVLVEGRQLSRRPEPQRAALRAGRIGVLFQSGNLLDHLTAAQNVVLAQRVAGRPSPTRAAALLDALGLARRANARPGELSGGEAARAGLAVALANDPAVVLADEPTGELDAAGGAVVVATHSPAVAAVASRTVRLEDGRVRP
jgi:putative ABC transport system ATP-binding protein